MVAASLFIFFLGLLIGSFLNVVILRYNTGKSLRGRSACLSCATTLLWYELIPVGSYLVQFGRCRSCGSALSPQYPFVELLTALLFLGLHLKFFSGVFSTAYFLQFGIGAMLMALLTIILIYDLRHKIIPNVFVYVAALLALGSLFLDAQGFLLALPSIEMIAAGPLLALPFALLWLFSGGRWMGLGDAKLALVMGWSLGLTQGLTAVLLAFWMGALVSVVLLLLSRAALVSGGNYWLPVRIPLLTMKSEVPFAPFLLLGFWFVFFSGFNLFSHLLLR